MTVNFEIKSQLAKLLATEDLVVENKDVETAEFNVHTMSCTFIEINRKYVVIIRFAPPGTQGGNSRGDSFHNQHRSICCGSTAGSIYCFR